MEYTDPITLHKSALDIMKVLKPDGVVRFVGFEPQILDKVAEFELNHLTPIAVLILSEEFNQLKNLLQCGESDVFNCGYGHVYSVKEVVYTVKNVTGIDKVEETERRAGDPAVLVADNTKLKQKLNWKPEFDNL